MVTARRNPYAPPIAELGGIAPLSSEPTSKRLHVSCLLVSALAGIVCISVTIILGFMVFDSYRHLEPRFRVGSAIVLLVAATSLSILFTLGASEARLNRFEVRNVALMRSCIWLGALVLVSLAWEVAASLVR